MIVSIIDVVYMLIVFDNVDLNCFISCAQQQDGSINFFGMTINASIADYKLFGQSIHLAPLIKLINIF